MVSDGIANPTPCANGIMAVLMPMTLPSRSASGPPLFPGLIAAPAVIVTNPLSAELSELRQSLIPGLINALRFNLNRQADAFHAFEIAKVFHGGDAGAVEGHRLAGIGYGQLVFGGIGQPGINASFFTIKGILETYFEAIGIANQVEFSAAAGFTIVGAAAVWDA